MYAETQWRPGVSSVKARDESFWKPLMAEGHAWVHLHDVLASLWPWRASHEAPQAVPTPTCRRHNRKTNDPSWGENRDALSVLWLVICVYCSQVECRQGSARDGRCTCSSIAPVPQLAELLPRPDFLTLNWVVAHRTGWVEVRSWPHEGVQTLCSILFAFGRQHYWLKAT